MAFCDSKCCLKICFKLIFTHFYFILVFYFYFFLAFYSYFLFAISFYFLLLLFSCFGKIIALFQDGGTTMNSNELNFTVPLATGESDSEEIEVNLLENQKAHVYLYIKSSQHSFGGGSFPTDFKSLKYIPARKTLVRNKNKCFRSLTKSKLVYNIYTIFSLQFKTSSYKNIHFYM